MPILKPKERLGTKIAGRYKLTEILGKGGMGTVFGGTHAWTGREVAVKILHPSYTDDEEVVRRFLQEARSAAKLTHPHVVDVLDMGQDDDDTVYLVLPRLRGEPLNERIARGPIPPEEAVRLLEPIMDALALAHEKEIVHRDLKPANIFLAEDPRHGVVPTLLDFGIAKVTGDTVQTVTGAVLGTPSYMSPEQASAEPTIGPPSDVWSMAIVLYEALTGARVFHANSSAAVLAEIVASPPELDLGPRLEEQGKELPAPLRALIEEALRREPEARPGMSEMAQRALAAVGLRESAARKADAEAPDPEAPDPDRAEENSSPEPAAALDSSLDTRAEENSEGEDPEGELEVPETVLSSPRTEVGAGSRGGLRPLMIGAVVVLVLGALGVGLALGGQAPAEGGEVPPRSVPEAPVEVAQEPVEESVEVEPEPEPEPERPSAPLAEAPEAPPEAEAPLAEGGEEEPAPLSAPRPGRGRAHHEAPPGGETRHGEREEPEGRSEGGAGVFEVGL